MFTRTKSLAALAVTAAALIGAGSASAASFGADVKPDVQPSNAGTAHPCDYNAPQHKCTWVLNDAYGNPGGEKAPKSGELTSIKLIAGEAGSFKLQLVKVRGDDSAKVLEQGPRIKYEGQDPNMDPDADYKVEKFTLDHPMAVHKGAQLAIVAKKTSTLRCSSGGDNTLLFDPPLTSAASFTNPSSTDGCWMPIEGNVR
jgi:hypothetical protein